MDAEQLTNTQKNLFQIQKLKGIRKTKQCENLLLVKVELFIQVEADSPIIIK